MRDRVTKSVVAYVAVIGVAAAVTFWMWPLPPSWPHAVVAIAFLIPGRIQGALWRDFFRGRHALQEGRVLEAVVNFNRFEAALLRRPWLRYAIFLQWSFYTWNAEALLRNNLAACDLARGELDAAEAGFQRARALDPGNPLPYFNLAVIAQAKGLPEGAGELLREAKARGFRGGTRERVIAMAGGILASVEGRP
jgi:tetratricopeptide (TPR) repeat protein